MAQEATVLVYEMTDYRIDNSEWMRNGDYYPTRKRAQEEAVNLLFNVKTQSNPENTVGLMTMAGKCPETLVTLTSDSGKIYAGLHNANISGQVRFCTGIKIAQLVLKNRQHTNHRQRIIVFVGSPIYEEEPELIQLGKKMKKNSIAVDVVNFGEISANTPKLEAFVAAVNSNDNSHLVTVNPGLQINDAILSSAMVAGDSGAANYLNAAQYEFGVDPNVDPELALALRLSMQEEEARQNSTAEPMEVDMSNMTEEEQLLRAIQMSMEPEDNK